MSKSLNLLTLSCLLLFAIHCSLFTAAAQSSTATLSGTVEDTNGQIIPAATVTLTDPAKGLRRTAATNDSGYFTFVLLPASTYTLLVEQTGFGRAQFENIVLNVGDQKAIKVELKVGDVTAQIEVRPDESLVRTDGSVGTVIDNQFVRNLPMNGRSFQTLLELTPGIVITPSNLGNPGQFSVNGQRTSTNYFTVDGVSANTGIASTGSSAGQTAAGTTPGMTASGTTASLVSADSLQEFRIQTSSYSAEFGRQPGGQVQLVTKSGGNDFHGTVYDYIRNEALDANDWFNNRNRIAKPPMRQHLFGGTFSGPIYFPNFGDGGKRVYSGKDRTFFFLSYEALRLRLPRSGETFVPSLCFRGEVAQCAAGQTPALEIYWPLLKSFPKPNGPDQANGFARLAYSYADPSTYEATALRIDHSLGKVTLFGRFAYSPSKSSTRDRFSLAWTQNSTQKNASLTTGAIWTPTNNIVNDFRLSYSTNSGPFFRQPDDFGGAVPLQTFGFLGRDPATAAFNISIAGTPNFSFSQQWGTVIALEQRQLNIVDNLSVNLGNHQLKFGIDYRRSNPLLQSGANGQESLGFNIANFTAGNPRSGRAASYFIRVYDAQPHAVAFDNLSVYAQDTWKFNKRLTLTLGLRWEFVPPPHATEGPDGVVLDGLDNPRLANNVGVAADGTSPWKTHYLNFAPRVGASYLLVDKPSRELVVRGGAGLFYDLGLGNSGDGFGGLLTWPFTASIIYPRSGHPDPACSIPTPAPNPPIGIPFPLPSCAFVPPSSADAPGNFSAMDPNIVLPRTYQWNLSVEQSLGTNRTLSISYVGAEARELLKNDSYQGIRFRGITYQGTTSTILDIQRNGGYSDYRSLQFQFRQRLSRGFQSIVNYTLGRSRDTDSSDNGIGIPSEVIPPSAQYGYSDYDVRHNFTAAATYQIPGFKNNIFLKALTRDWGIDLMMRARSSFPINATTLVSFPSLPNTIFVQANVVPGQPFWVDDPTAPKGRRLNRLAFTVPASGTVGNLPRNTLRGFGAKQVDLSLSRNFELLEKVKLQIRVDAFNVFNWPNFGNPSGVFGANTLPQNYGAAAAMLNRSLGGISSLYQIGGPRSLQGMLRISF